MLACPRCRTSLATVTVGRGVAWGCARCGGRAATMAVLRPRVDPGAFERLQRQASAEAPVAGCRCPSCLRSTSRVDLSLEGGILTLDACPRCALVWFDRGELEALPRPPVRTPSLETLQTRGEEAHGRMRQKEQRSTAAVGESFRSPEERWKLWAGVLGMPVEIGEPPIVRVPWATRALVVAILFATLVEFTDAEAVVKAFGFVPAEASRLLGATWLTSFFLHAGWMHLIGNLYFLWMFGDNVEDLLGRGKYLLLVFAALLLGDYLQYAFTEHPEMPVIGASGGISGVITFYALQLPRVRIGVIPFAFFQMLTGRIAWLRIPVRGALALSFAMQLLGPLGGQDRIAYFAHIGGAAAGWLFWLLPRQRARRTAAIRA